MQTPGRNWLLSYLVVELKGDEEAFDGLSGLGERNSTGGRRERLRM
jgi:hypothetical protein